MGVDRRDYIVVGADIGYEYYNDDNYEFYDEYSLQCEEGRITFLIDCYSSDYFIVGEVLQSEYGYYDGLNYSLFGREAQIELAKIRIKDFIKNKFGIDCIPHIIIKTHFY